MAMAMEMGTEMGTEMEMGRMVPVVEMVTEDLLVVALKVANQHPARHKEIPEGRTRLHLPPLAVLEARLEGALVATAVAMGPAAPTVPVLDQVVHLPMAA